MIKLKQIDKNEVEIDLSNPIIKAHFDAPNNYAEIVVNEFNSEPFGDYISEQDKIILDIGANIGLFALLVLPYAERIISVEPTVSHNEVYRNLLSNSKKVELESAALNSYTGEASWRVEPVNTTMNTLDFLTTETKVPCITLYDLCQKYNLKHVDLCKIDIEGSEFRALTVETVQPVHSIIDKFIIEVHPRNLESQEHFKAIFEQCGYKVKFFDFNGSVFCYK
jgi:FkbM family methyltransferase